MEIGHLAREELDVGAADAGSLDVDDDLAGRRHRASDLLDPGRPGPGDHERPHRLGHRRSVANARAIVADRSRRRRSRSRRRPATIAAMVRGHGWSRRAAAIVAVAAIATLAPRAAATVAPTPAPPGPSALAPAPTQTPSSTPTARPSASPSPAPSASPIAEHQARSRPPARRRRGRLPGLRRARRPPPRARSSPRPPSTGAATSPASPAPGSSASRPAGREPKLHCPTKGVRSVAIWVGIDGDRGATKTRPLIQVGTAGECRGGVERHYAWHQIYPNQPYSRSFGAVIKPGDRMAASVVFRKREFVLTRRRPDDGGDLDWSRSRRRRPPGRSAEWIVEAPTGDCPGHCHQLTLPSFAPDPVHATPRRRSATTSAASSARGTGSGRRWVSRRAPRW